MKVIVKVFPMIIKSESHRGTAKDLGKHMIVSFTLNTNKHYQPLNSANYKEGKISGKHIGKQEKHIPKYSISTNFIVLFIKNDQLQVAFSTF